MSLKFFLLDIQQSTAASSRHLFAIHIDEICCQAHPKSHILPSCPQRFPPLSWVAPVVGVTLSSSFGMMEKFLPSLDPGLPFHLVTVPKAVRCWVSIIMPENMGPCDLYHFAMHLFFVGSSCITYSPQPWRYVELLRREIWNSSHSISSLVAQATSHRENDSYRKVLIAEASAFGCFCSCPKYYWPAVLLQVGASPYAALLTVWSTQNNLGSIRSCAQVIDSVFSRHACTVVTWISKCCNDREVFLGMISFLSVIVANTCAYLVDHNASHIGTESAQMRADGFCR